MSLNNNDVKNEIVQKNPFHKKPFTKEMLQDLLKKHLNQRLIKLEDSTKDQITSLNTTSKYFKEFAKAIEQFSKLLEESEELKEKELTEKKDNNKEKNKDNNNLSKYSSKKSNELHGSTNLTKNSSKIKLNNKKMDSFKNRCNTQRTFKPQQLKKQATNINLARSIFSNKIIEEKKVNKQKKNIIRSSDMDKVNKSIYTHRDGINETPVRIKSSFCLDKTGVNLKMPKTEKRIKANHNKKNSIKDKDKNKNTHKSNNLSEY